jgi:non-ribosomal peptide synthetase component F
MSGETFTTLFDTTAARRPDHLAVDDGEWRLTYRELDAHGAWLAARLIAERVAPQERVVVLAERGIPGLVAILGALKAGAVYVPLDPQNPPGRLAEIVADVRPAIVVAAERQLEVGRRVGARCLALDDVRAQLASAHPGAAGRSLPHVDEHDVAYCMYTSGSTGTPRGVEIEHRSVVAFIRAFDAYMHFTDDSRCLNTAPYHFDVSVSDVLMPLALGASVYMVRNLLPPSRVLERIEQARVTHFCPPAPLLTLLCGPGSTFEKRTLTSLRCIMTGAEVIGRHVVEKWLGAVPGLRLLNAYGPTEATCACMAHEITAANLGDASATMGSSPSGGRSTASPRCCSIPTPASHRRDARGNSRWPACRSCAGTGTGPPRRPRARCSTRDARTTGPATCARSMHGAGITFAAGRTTRSRCGATA